ncbi:hypothetical protein LOCC1_G004617 [Lachnellula occidentalis]|uniref:Uncharacterized protein n=1 Tax=Lachnellula occidentalis TaxID=215460 RepID=A0A8H8UFV9_9HELO|nr:hypothetical protein LOCC1_G004617 [Lachnellula occidentalis]
MSSSTIAGSVDVQPPSTRDVNNLDELRRILTDLKEVAASGQLPEVPGLQDDNEGYFTPPEQAQSQSSGQDGGQSDEQVYGQNDNGGDYPSSLAEECSESDVEDEDLTPLEYARYHGLSRDPLTDPRAFAHIEALQVNILENNVDDCLPQFDFGVDPRLDERLTVSKEALQFVRSVAHQDTQESIDALILSMLGNPGVINSRIELPLLKTDHETDCRHFARWDSFEIKPQDVKFPLEVVDDEKNEGIKFPSAYWKLGDAIMEELKKEKIEVSKNTMLFLTEALTNVWAKEDDEELWQTEMAYKRNTALEPVTPPLFPISPPFKPYEPSPSSPTFQLPVLSDPPSLIKEDLESTENVIFQQDVPTPLRNATLKTIPSAEDDCSSSDTYLGDGTVKLSDIYSPMASLEGETPPSVHTQRCKPDDFKVEGPLTPPKPTVTASKTVRFSDYVEEMKLDPPSPVVSPPAETFFNDAFAEAAETVKQQLEQESLVNADTTARVEVRTMESVVTKPPWQKFQDCKSSTEILAFQLETMRSISDSKQRKWAGVKYSSIQEKLRYNPFPHDLAKVALEETSQGSDAMWQSFVEDAKGEEIIDSSSLAWKPPGLRILTIDEDDDDEIDPAKFVTDHPKDMYLLVKKRKLELDDNGATELATQQPHNFPDKGAESTLQTMQPPRRFTPTPNDLVIAAAQTKQLDRSEDPGLLLGGQFSAENMLGNFMELRGVKKLKLMNSSYYPNKAVNAASIPRNPTPAIPAQPSQTPDAQLTLRQSPISKHTFLPAPIAISRGPQSAIVSSALFGQRALIRHLETILPSLTLVERNFAAHNTTAWMPGSVTRSPITSPLDSEADVIVSASTGVILTTRQKIKQKPLPGHKTKAEIRARLEKVSLRYEKLVVLITEGRQDEATNGIDENDCLALSEFMGFTASLMAETTVQFIGGGEQTLAKWLASIAVQARMTGSTELLADETHWELFLRRAGMNAFAAQEVLAKLKAPDGVNDKSPSKAGQFGLTAFVEMGREQRIARFAGLCGRGVLERVSAVVDARWD